MRGTESLVHARGSSPPAVSCQRHPPYRAALIRAFFTVALNWACTILKKGPVIYSFTAEAVVSVLLPSRDPALRKTGVHSTGIRDLKPRFSPLQATPSLNPFTTLNPFLGPVLLGFRIGRGSGAPQGLK